MTPGGAVEQLMTVYRVEVNAASTSEGVQTLDSSAVMHSHISKRGIWALQKP